MPIKIQDQKGIRVDEMFHGDIGVLTEWVNGAKMVRAVMVFERGLITLTSPVEKITAVDSLDLRIVPLSKGALLEVE